MKLKHLWVIHISFIGESILLYSYSIIRCLSSHSNRWNHSSLISCCGMQLDFGSGAPFQKE